MNFWGWAVKAYGGEGVAEACLNLQDEDGQNVPLLLWAVWMACEGRSVNDKLASEAVALTRPWAESLIVPLRALRRRLKSELTAGDNELRLPLRQKIKQAELDAEQALMALLAKLASGKNIEIHDVTVLAQANLDRVCGAWSIDMPHNGLRRLTEALSEGGFLRYKG